jgi:HemY protein
MIRVVLFLCAVGLVAVGVTWLADRPGDVAITWQGLRIETSVMVLLLGVVGAAMATMLVFWITGLLWRAPKRARRAFERRRRRAGRRAITLGLVSVGAGDARAAAKYAKLAHRVASEEPLSLLLRAQTAQIMGDRRGAERAFRSMVERTDTRLLGLHGLYIEARRRADPAAARQFAEEAVKTAPAVPWAGQAVLEFRCAEADWEGALAILDTNRAHGLIDKPTYERHGAVLLTARASALEETDPGVAKMLAVEAVRLAPNLIPAAALAGRLLGDAGEPRWAGTILQAAWRHNPHPDLAEAYAHLRPGDSARDRLARLRMLVRDPPGHVEGALALARAALDARELGLARQTLEPLLSRPSQRVAMLMAELEELQHGDVGRAREWMARALRAARDPAWTADGFVSDRWLPMSPVTGRIDAFEWKVPLEEVPGPARVIEEPAGPEIAAPVESELATIAPKSEAPEVASSVPGPRASPAGEVPPQPSRPTPAAPPAAATSTAIEPIVPLRHAPDDPGPDPEPLDDARIDGPSRNGGWRFGSLFR